jgi:hypothetical protein
MVTVIFCWKDDAATPVFGHTRPIEILVKAQKKVVGMVL